MSDARRRRQARQRKDPEDRFDEILPGWERLDGDTCPRVLARKHCLRLSGGLRRKPCACDSLEYPTWDHVTRWRTPRGEKVIVFCPYHIEEPVLESLEAAGLKLGLHVEQGEGVSPYGNDTLWFWMCRQVDRRSVFEQIVPYRPAGRGDGRRAAPTTTPRLSREGGMRTGIFKHSGDRISVQSDCTDVRDLQETFATAYESLVKNGATPQQKRQALDGYTQLYLAGSGYKASGVKERIVRVVGDWPHPSEEPAYAAEVQVPEKGEPDDEL